MTKKYTLIIERDEDGWLISEVVELPGCHTQAKSMDALLERTKEAIRACQQPPVNRPAACFACPTNITNGC